MTDLRNMDDGGPRAPGGNAVAKLAGLRVLVVEDEPMVAMTLEDALAEFGCELVASAETVADALVAVEAAPAIDVAVLDVNLGGEKVFPVADALDARGVPFAFSTGYGPADLPERYPGSGLLSKPYPPLALARTLAELADQR